MASPGLFSAPAIHGLRGSALHGGARAIRGPAGAPPLAIHGSLRPLRGWAPAAAAWPRPPWLAVRPFTNDHAVTRAFRPSRRNTKESCHQFRGTRSRQSPERTGAAAETTEGKTLNPLAFLVRQHFLAIFERQG
jgi:hypothetical protein